VDAAKENIAPVNKIYLQGIKGDEGAESGSMFAPPRTGTLHISTPAKTAIFQSQVRQTS